MEHDGGALPLRRHHTPAIVGDVFDRRCSPARQRAKRAGPVALGVLIDERVVSGGLLRSGLRRRNQQGRERRGDQCEVWTDVSYVSRHCFGSSIATIALPYHR